MSQCRTDRILLASLKASAIASGLIAALIAAFLLIESIPAFRQIGIQKFLFDPSWHPAPHSGEHRFNLLPMVLGTMAVSVAAIFIATPFGIASALFCHFYAPKKLGRIYRRIIELLAGIPSVVYGFWGLVTIVPLINSIEPPGASLLAGALILSLMILPTVALLALACFATIPPEYLKGSAALGLSQWNTIRGVIFPSVKSGLLTAVILQTGRAVGETMAVVMVCGNIVQVPSSFFDPIRTLTANIALEMAYAVDAHRSALFVSGLLLLLLITSLVALAGVVSKRYVY